MSSAYGMQTSTELDYVCGQEALLHMDSICRIANGQRETDGFLEIYSSFGEFYAGHG